MPDAAAVFWTVAPIVVRSGGARPDRRPAPPRSSDDEPDTLFVFENHDGLSLVPEICRDILARVDRRNIRMNFDPINFAHAGVDPAGALAIVHPLIAHVHLKDLACGAFCEFGAGDVDLSAILVRTLTERGYEGRFTVEYEGPSTIRRGCSRALNAPEPQPWHRSALTISIRRRPAGRLERSVVGEDRADVSLSSRTVRVTASPSHVGLARRQRRRRQPAAVHRRPREYRAPVVVGAIVVPPP